MLPRLNVKVKDLTDNNQKKDEILAAEATQLFELETQRNTMVAGKQQLIDKVKILT